jgi:hypothetical protein
VRPSMTKKLFKVGHSSLERFFPTGWNVKDLFMRRLSALRV